jgi:hypothetical protein
MDLPLCLYLKPDGTRCGSPAMRDHHFCYHHETVRKLVPKTGVYMLQYQGKTGEPYDPYELPYLDNNTAIQIGFMQIIHGVGSGLIEPKRARLMLSALFGASANLREMNKSAARMKAAHEVAERYVAKSLNLKKKPSSVAKNKVKSENSA